MVQIQCGFRTGSANVDSGQAQHYTVGTPRMDPEQPTTDAWAEWYGADAIQAIPPRVTDLIASRRLSESSPDRDQQAVVAGTHSSRDA